MAGQVTVDLNITGGNSFDLAKEEVEDGVVPPGEPPLVQGNWAEVDDVRQCAIRAGAEWAGRHHSLSPSPEVVGRGKGVGSELDTEGHDVSGEPPDNGLPGDGLLLLYEQLSELPLHCEFANFVVPCSENVLVDTFFDSFFCFGDFMSQ